MVIAQNKPPALPAKLPSRPPSSPEQPALSPEQPAPTPEQPALTPEQPAFSPEQPTPTRAEVFYRSSARCARSLAQIGGFTNGASVGYLGGALIAGSRGTTGTVALGLAVAGAAVGGAVGWKTMGKVSDWAAHLAQRLAPPQNALQAETAGRVALNLAVDLLSGSPITAAVDLGITAAWGTYRSTRNPSPPPQS